MQPEERHLAECIARLAYANPFLTERIECEREILGSDFASGRQFWHVDQGSEQIGAIQARVEPLVETLGERLRAGVRGSVKELRLYRDVVLYWVYNRYEADFLHLVERRDHVTRKVAFYSQFAADYERAADLAGNFEGEMSVEHIFAFFFQVRRAFHLIFRHI
ncbi:MAG: hypothetical protein O7A04_00740, partial [Acidobacteria bacterium]|nr:hypothetical protein [Acidobacteriota bacterium]